MLDFAAVSAILARGPVDLACKTDTMPSDRGKLIVYCSLDTGLQSFITRLMNQYHPRFGACAVINSKTGRVLAFASHQEPGTPKVGGRLFLRNVFPAASIYKTITAAAAIETARYTVDTKVPITGRSHTLYMSQLRKNINSPKEIPFEDAYAQSINPVFGRIGMYGVGKKTFEEYNERFGFNAAIPFELPTDTSKVTVPDDTTYEMAQLASGYNRKTSISPLHGALIASAVAEGGFMPCPRLVDSIATLGGECLYRSVPAAWKTPISDSTAAELKAMMGQVVDSGTARRTFRLLKRCNGADLLECGGKTGSIKVDSLGNIEWFIGFAVKKDDPDGHLALAVVTAHGGNLTVHSHFIGAEIFRKLLCPPGTEPLRPAPTGRVRSHRVHHPAKSNS
jgi:cell division protein FtsI/penicillin-binding protein 2